MTTRVHASDDETLAQKAANDLLGYLSIGVLAALLIVWAVTR